VLLGLAAALVVTALVVTGVLLGSRGGQTTAAADTDPPSAVAPSTSSAAPTGSSAAPSPTPGPTGGAGGDGEFPPALPAVALDEAVAVEEVTASIASIEEIEGQATGPGDVAGPALRITVRIVNETGGDVPLDGVAVNAYHGADLTPATPLDDPSRSWFTGLLPAGEAVEGVYVFRVPPEARDHVTVEVGYRPGAPLALFTGAV
jgi:hypothetical protein